MSALRQLHVRLLAQSLSSAEVVSALGPAGVSNLTRRVAAAAVLAAGFIAAHPALAAKHDVPPPVRVVYTPADNTGMVMGGLTKVGGWITSAAGQASQWVSGGSDAVTYQTVPDKGKTALTKQDDANLKVLQEQALGAKSRFITAKAGGRVDPNLASRFDSARQKYMITVANLWEKNYLHEEDGGAGDAAMMRHVAVAGCLGNLSKGDTFEDLKAVEDACRMKHPDYAKAARQWENEHNVVR